MTRKNLYALSLLSVAFYMKAYALECSDFGTFHQYNGHYYAISGSKYTFAQAKQIAENNNGYIAIPNDSSENNFLATTFGTGWIGVYDPSYSQNGLCYVGNICTTNSSRFLTVKGTSLAYSNWASGEPDNKVYEYDIIDNKQMVAPLGEHWAVIGINGQWGSFGNHASENNNPVQFKAIMEFDTQPTCSSDSNASGITTEKKCVESIYNSGSTSSGGVVTDSSGNALLTSSNLYTCLTDTNGNEYCPAQLSPCDTVWGYQDGYSTSHQICGDGSQPVNNLCKSTTKACDSVGGTWNGKDCTVSNQGVINSLHITGDPANLSCSNIIRIVAISNHTFVNGDSSKDWSPTLIQGLNNNLFYINDIPFVATYSYHLLNDGSYNSYFYATIKNQDTGQVYTYGAGWRFPDKKNLYGYYTTNDYAHHQLTYNIQSDYISVTITPTPYKAYYCQTSETITLASKTTSTVEPACSNVSADGYCYSTPMTYYTYHCSSTPNEYGQTATVINPGGTTSTSETPPTGNCKTESFSCVPASDRKCAYVNNSWKCSPFPCFGETNLENADTTVGANDSANKGFNSDGSCSYQIRLFNGKDMRCRSWDILFGLMGGGCCQKEKSGGLGSMFASQCTSDEKLLSKYRKETQDKSVEIGEYCSKYLKLGFAKICTQKKKTYCVFNSKLARIIHQQGRPQIGLTWGDAKGPNCKGFTPEEFQKIDFSKLDLSEFYGDLQSKIQTTIDAKIGTTIQQKVQSFGVNIKGSN